MSVSPRSRRRRRKLLALTSLGLAGLLAGLLSGCAGSSNAVATPAGTRSFAALAGNWKFTAASTSRYSLSSVSGSLSVNGTSVTGILHPASATCAPVTSSFAVAGTIDPAAGTLLLTSSGFSGGTLTLSATIGADAKSVTDLSYTVSGACAAAPAGSFLTARGGATPAIGQQYQPISGTYTGTFADRDGVVLPVSAVLTQTSTADANGSFHLTGNATFTNNPCINTPVVTDSVVTGDTVSATYTDPQTHNTVVGSGTFNADASTLTITSWTLTGTCGTETGTGLLSKPI